jgi:HEPN domain-containing protein
MPPSEATLLLLRKAGEDEALLDEVLDSRRVTDAIFGFHAQQSVEKLLKAVLSDASILYPLTHRLAQLIDLIRDNGIDFPAEFDALTMLTPFAVEFRYDAVPEEDEEPLDRRAVRSSLIDLRAWVESRVWADLDSRSP